MSYIYHGFKSWTIQAAQESRKAEAKDKQFKASMTAEATLQQAIEQQGYQPYMNKRIYSDKFGHRREIDAIVVTDQAILVIEIKNWVGKVWRRGLRWYQQPPGRATLEFEDLVVENKKKAEVMKEYLEKQPGVLSKGGGAPAPGEPGLPEKAIQSVIVFTHPRVKLDPSTLTDGESKDDNIFTLKTFSEWLKASRLRSSAAITGEGHGAGSGYWQAFSDTFWSYVPKMAPLPPVLTENQVRACCKALDEVKTWDTIFLHNGTMINGDITKLVIPSRKILFDRNEIDYCRMEWAANTFLGCLSSMYSGAAGHIIIQMKPRKGLQKDKLKLTIPVQMGYAKDKARVDHLEIKPAGKRHSEIHNLQYVKGIAYGAGGGVSGGALSVDPTAEGNKRWM